MIQKDAIVKEKLAFTMTRVISKMIHTNILKYLNDQEVMFSANKEGTLVTVIPKEERKMGISV